MFDRWKLSDFAPGEGVACAAYAEPFDDAAWIPAEVPGDVHTALIGAGRLPDPFYDRNELACAWVEDREWWYRVRFAGPQEPLESDERLRLVFEGLDTFVTIWLNGNELGRHKNMFREADFDVTSAVRIGQDNTLALCFDRPLDHAELPDGGPRPDWTPPRASMRKAQFGYGWDWGPRLPTVGVWRPVELRRQRCAGLTSVRFATLDLHQQGGRALVSVSVEAEQFAGSGQCAAAIVLRAPVSGALVAEQVLVLSRSGEKLQGTAFISLDRPQLWWTHDLGEPALYTLEVGLKHGDSVVDSAVQRVGIRTLTLDQTPDQEEPGTRFFRFVLNGVLLFARGTNWIPADSFVGAIRPERYTKLLSLARAGNQTMLRVWGGGIYEHDAFYDECDRIGLLVWQDFMFACAAYPEDAAMVAEVEAEARYQVRRLRNHPCLALWCGNNENQWLWDQKDYEHPGTRVLGFLYYHRVLPSVVAELDGCTPYWPGSPYGGNDHNGMEDGDRHNWDVWHGLRPRRFGEEQQGDSTSQGVSYIHYGQDTGRFISEFGMHAAPVIETLRRSMPAGQLFHHSEAMDHHNKDNPKNKGDNLMQVTTGLPGDLDEYIDFSMMAQAEGLKFGVEHFRRRFPHCAGSLVWQLNDCWPVLSWSVLDYYGFGKAGYYYLTRAFAPVIASFALLDSGAVELWLTSNSLEWINDDVVVQLGLFGGEVVWRERLAVSVPANTSTVAKGWSADQVQGAANRYIVVKSGSGVFPRNRAFFRMMKDLDRPAGQVEVTLREVDATTVEARFVARTYAYFVHLEVPLEDTRYSDNYFDLLPGEERAIVIRNAVKGITAGQVKVSWR